MFAMTSLKTKPAQLARSKDNKDGEKYSCERSIAGSFTVDFQLAVSEDLCTLDSQKQLSVNLQNISGNSNPYC